MKKYTVISTLAVLFVAPSLLQAAQEESRLPLAVAACQALPRYTVPVSSVGKKLSINYRTKKESKKTAKDIKTDNPALMMQLLKGNNQVLTTPCPDDLGPEVHFSNSAPTTVFPFYQEDPASKNGDEEEIEEGLYEVIIREGAVCNLEREAHKRKLSCTTHSYAGKRYWACPSHEHRYVTAKSSHMKAHLKSMHLGLRQFVCSYPECQRSYDGFSRAQSLKRHVNMTHLNLRPHFCKKCNRSFGRPDHLQSHARTCNTTKRKKLHTPHLPPDQPKGMVNSDTLPLEKQIAAPKQLEVPTLDPFPNTDQQEEERSLTPDTISLPAYDQSDLGDPEFQISPTQISPLKLSPTTLALFPALAHLIN